MDSDLFLTKIENTVYDNCEWCFQFDDEEPRVFAAAEKPEDPIEIPKVTFTLSNNSNSNIVFSHNGRQFKLFARELTEDGKKIIIKTAEKYEQ
jgi:hypothetical protein